jgi:hypothetical protein
MLTKKRKERLSDIHISIIESQVVALYELYQQYKYGDHKTTCLTCPLCQVTLSPDDIVQCSQCPWVWYTGKSCLHYPDLLFLNQKDPFTRKDLIEESKRAVARRMNHIEVWIADLERYIKMRRKK